MAALAAAAAAAAVGSAVFPAQRLQVVSKRRSTASFFPSIQLRAVAATKRFQLLACSAKQDTIERVCEIVKNQLAVEEGKIVSGESKFVDLGADSLDTVEIVMGLEEAFGITVDESSAQEIKTVEDAANLIDDLVKQKGA